MAKRRGDNATLDLFAEHDLFPVRVPSDLPRAMDFRAKLSSAISRAMKESPDSRAQIAADMSEILGEDLSVHMLNNYASPGKDAHDISVVRLKALIRATEAHWLWEVALEGEGLTLMQGPEAIYAQLGLAQRKAAEATEQVKRLKGIVGDIEGRGADK